MLPRQDSRLSSSRRQTPPPEARDRPKSVGCMSGIFRLISKYQNRHKLLTFGRKVEKKAATITTKTVNIKVEDQEKIKEDCKTESESLQNIAVKRLSCNVDPRSPILSPKLRWANGDNVTENGKNPPPVVEQEKEESSEAKRQRLLEALEKCKEDLEALKMIIKAVQSDGKSVPPPRLLNSVKGDGEEEEENINNGGNEKNEEVKMERWSISSCSIYSKSHANDNVEQVSRESSKTKPEEDENNGVYFFDKFVREPYGKKRKPISTTIWASRALVRSVEEVCNDVVWGQKREVANIGVMLHNYICKDLIEETIKELGYHKMYGLPRQACKRRLSL